MALNLDDLLAPGGRAHRALQAAGAAQAWQRQRTPWPTVGEQLAHLPAGSFELDRSSGTLAAAAQDQSRLVLMRATRTMLLTRGTVQCEFDSGETAELLIPNDINSRWLLIEVAPEPATPLTPGAGTVAGTVLASDFWGHHDILVLPRFDPDPARCFAQMVTNDAVLEELGPTPLPGDAPAAWMSRNWVADLLNGRPIRGGEERYELAGQPLRE